MKETKKWAKSGVESGERERDDVVRARRAVGVGRIKSGAVGWDSEKISKHAFKRPAARPR